ncbi:MAG: type II toxin-antitoxin system VapC family toxin [Blastocatellia bacterium]
MPLVTFDSSIFISRQIEIPQTGFVLSAAVVQEMTAGAADKSNLRKWELAWRVFEKADRLLVPTGEDWYEAGKILNSLLRGLKSKAKGLTPRLHPDDKQRMVRDALLARTAMRAGVLVVTENLKDFERIQRFCRVKIVSGDDFFA